MAARAQKRFERNALLICVRDFGIICILVEIMISYEPGPDCSKLA